MEKLVEAILTVGLVALTIVGIIVIYPVSKGFGLAMAIGLPLILCSRIITKYIL